jgi:hypothetical protein
VLSDVENVLSQSDTMVDTLDANIEGDNDDLLSCDEDLLPKDTFEYSTFGGKQSLFLTEIETAQTPTMLDQNNMKSAKQVDSLLLISARQVEHSLEGSKDAVAKPVITIKRKGPSLPLSNTKRSKSTRQNSSHSLSSRMPSSA